LITTTTTATTTTTTTATPPPPTTTTNKEQQLNEITELQNKQNKQKTNKQKTNQAQITTIAAKSNQSNTKMMVVVLWGFFVVAFALVLCLL